MTERELPARRRRQKPAPISHEEAFRTALRLVESRGTASPERIAALRAAIASGAYDPDPYEIARKILEDGI